MIDVCFVQWFDRVKELAENDPDFIPEDLEASYWIAEYVTGETPESAVKNYYG